jgi:methyltransferase FkbM-like protein
MVFFGRTDRDTSPDRGLGHLLSARAGDTIPVSAESLDDCMRTQAPPDFLKCGAEGAEGAVVERFREAQRLVQEKRPGIICEMHSEENQRNLLEEFSRFGYTCKPCGASHILALPQ